MEASGTGNMKLALNGALTIGTLDGANIEIRDRVRADDIFIFGLTAEENAALRALGQYDPWHHYQRDPVLAGVVDALREGIFAGGDRNMLRPIWSSLMEHGDRYHHLADFGSYMAAQTRVEALWAEPGRWAAAGIRNIAAMGYFSSDRAIREYVDSIWGLEPVAVAAARR
jgi:starch phosphorylase